MESPRAWPVEFVYESPSKEICNLFAPSDLKTYIDQANLEMVAKAVSLRKCCAELHGQPLDISNKFVQKQGCVWIAKPEFLLGEGTEAKIYMGLYSDPANPSESVLVAIKQSHDGTDPFNSQEIKHLMSLKLKRSTGIVYYHTSFTLEALETHSILALDIGLVSLKDLISKHKVKLSTEQKFKMTKALCLAVNELHTECSVVHRDLRPENVLLMPNGKVCITDFGLSRAAKVEGTVKHTMCPKTIMQPFEVQERYSDAKRAQVPITHGGDVFMLGCVLAFIHQGRDPFAVSADILNKKAPDLDNRIEIEQPWLYHLLRSMLNHDAKQRSPPLEEVLRPIEQ